MNVSSVRDIISKGENESVEFKQSFNSEAIESLSAFANTKGGTVFIGVNDNGDIVGVNLQQETVKNWINEIKGKTKPSIVPDYEESVMDDKTILVLSIKEFPIKPVSYKGKYFRRVSCSNSRMDASDISNMYLQTFNQSWDYYKCLSHSFEDISLEKVNDFIIRHNRVGIRPFRDDAMQVLRKYELLKDGSISNACYLLFAKSDLFMATIEMGRFEDEITIKDDRTLRSDLFTEVEEVIGFVMKHTNKRLLITGKAQRDERWDYPMDAIREIVINMIVHRDYMSSTDSVIKIFDDRIEFFNPGSLPSSISEEDLLTGDYTSVYRNKLVSVIFKEAGVIEKYGSGIKRINDAFVEYGLPAPKYDNMLSGFRVTTYLMGGTQETTQETTQEATPRTKELVLELLDNNPNFTRRDLSHNLNVSETAIKQHIAKLKAEGRLKRIGSTKAGYWQVIEK